MRPQTSHVMSKSGTRSSDELLRETIVCPRCHGRIALDDEVIRCGLCGPVGRRTLGYLDFTPSGGYLPLANGGKFDLRADEEVARQLTASSSGYEEMYKGALRLAWTKPESSGHSRAVEITSRRYTKVEDGAGDRHGTAILDKAAADLGLDELRGELALEAGGGFGKFLSGFRRAFSNVVYVDCSLARLLVADRLCREQGVDGVVFVRADVMQLPISANRFDFVHQGGVIEHVSDPTAMVNESVRTLGSRGVYVCMSPNRYPLTPEPHFNLPLFGLFPQRVRPFLLRHLRGDPDEAGTDLLSLSRLRRVAAAAGLEKAHIFFLPPLLLSIARQTPLRRVVQAVLGWRIPRAAVMFLANRLLLPVAPYHLLVYRRGTSGR